MANDHQQLLEAIKYLAKVPITANEYQHLLEATL